MGAGGRVTLGGVQTLGRPGGILGRYRTLALTIEPPLSGPEFGAWMVRTFHLDGPARLWGNPIPLGSTKAHVYGIDLETWARVDMEFTAGRFFLVAPQQGDRILPAIAARIAASVP